MKKINVPDINKLSQDTKKWGMVRHFGTETTNKGIMYSIKVLATNEVIVLPKSDFIKEVKNG